jgi:hypothetical protein
MKLYYTVPTGEQAAVWQQDGTYKTIQGPMRLFVGLQRIEPLQLITAKPNQYLKIHYKDGLIEHLKGPAKLFLDPVVHEAIDPYPAIEIDASEAIVVYNEDKGEVLRNIIRGPALHFPKANEWQHHFSWHGSKGQEHEDKVPSALRFTKLRTVPDQMYYRVKVVRTQDEAILDVRLMLFFELDDIEKMLNATHDPIADFINALTADVMDFVADKTFEQFKANTKQLNEMETYAQLLNRAERMGYKINKVAYRGYVANPKLQAMHDNAIETRTQLTLHAETEAQEQELADLKQQRELNRNITLREEENAAAEHQRKLERMEHAEHLRLRGQEFEAEIKNKKALNELELKHQEETNRERIKLYEGMTVAGIDLTQVLVAEHRNPDKLIRIDGGGLPQLHLHEDEQKTA